MQPPGDKQGGGQIFYVGGGSGHDDEEIDVSEMNIILSKASKKFKGTRQTWKKAQMHGHCPQKETTGNVISRRK